MNKATGSKIWAVKTGGALGRKDQGYLMAQGMLARLKLLPEKLRARMGLASEQVARIDPSSIRLPDSRSSQQALALITRLGQPWVLNHSVRTFVWGAMIAQKDGIGFDEELFYIASLLHDLGLTEAHNCKDATCACFAVEGARAAEDFASGLGWSNERRDLLSEAISLHLNVRVGLEQGAEAHLLHEGAALDVIGARIRELHPDTVQSVLTDWPRVNFKAEVSASIKAQARLRPSSRAALLAQLGFIGMVRAAPFEE